MADRLPNHRPAKKLKAVRSPESGDRPCAAKRGYNRTWTKLRTMILAGEPLCRMCSRPALDVDHIVPLSQGGGNDHGNLQPLCHSCHSKKTVMDRQNRLHRNRQEL